MTTEGVLVVYAVLVGFGAPRLLAATHWPSRAPRWGIAAWQSLSVSFVLAAVSAGLVAVMPTAPVSGGLSGLLRACVMALRAEYHLPGGSTTAVAGLGLALIVLAWAGGCTVHEIARAASQRGRHRALLSIVGRPDGRLGAVVVDHEAATVYCLPGRHRRVVLTTAAMRSLHDDELAAVLAHERAHLTGRHHLVLAAASGLARAFPFIPLLQEGKQQSAVLIEMLADDVACRDHRQLTVASALVTLAASRMPAAPASALAAAATAATIRVERLLAPEAPLRRAVTVALAGAALAVVAAPIGLLILPAAALVNGNYCPI